MAKVVVFGGTGYAGAAIAAEAARRGHAVTAVSRSAPRTPINGVSHVAGSALDATARAEAAGGADAIVVATSPRGDMAGRQLDVVRALAETAVAEGARLVVVGGFSSLRPAPGAPRFIEGEVPEPYREEAKAGHAVLEWLLEQPEPLRWTFVSPAAKFGAWVPGEATGAYRLGGEVAILDESGPSHVSAADFALAILDLVEAGEHERRHVGVVG